MSKLSQTTIEVSMHPYTTSYIKDRSSRTPPIVIKATCMRTPQTKSNKLNNLSRSSKDHSNGDIEPRSKVLHEIAKNPFRTLVNSNIITRTTETRSNRLKWSKYSTPKTNTCSLWTTLTYPNDQNKVPCCLTQSISSYPLFHLYLSKQIHRLNQSSAQTVLAGCCGPLP